MPNFSRKNILNHLRKISISVASTSLFLLFTPAPASAADEVAQVVSSESGKEVLNAALKMARSKPALSVAAGITCLACAPIVGVAGSPGLCIACGILIAKTLG